MKQQPAVLVSSDGKRTLPEDDAFFAALRDLSAGDDATGFAVRNLGFIKLQVVDARTTVIELNPCGVDRRALLAAERRIVNSRGQVFRIKCLAPHPLSGAALSAREAIACLRDLHAPGVNPGVNPGINPGVNPGANPGVNPGAGKRFRAEPQDYARLLCGGDSPLCDLNQKWCASFGVFDDTVIPFVMARDPAAKFVLAAMPTPGADLVFRFITGTFAWLDENYRRHAIGRKVDTLPDREYGAWAADHCKQVALTGEPRFDRVVAHIRFGAELHLCYVAKYERLLLPWRTATGETIVSLMACGLDGSGEIRAAA